MKFQIVRRFCSQRGRLAVSTNPTLDIIVKDEAIKAPALSIGLPLSEDLKAGSISSSIRTQWSNVPSQVRAVMEESQSTSLRSQLLGSEDITTGLGNAANKMLSLIGKGPADLQVDRVDYCKSFSVVPYQRGMKAAFHWPKVLIPRSVAARCWEDLRVDPVDSDRSVLLLDMLLDKTTVMFCFSGYDFSGLNTGVKAWKRVLELNDPRLQVLHVHICEGWLSRRTHPLTRQILRSFRSEDIETSKQDKVFIYRGKLNKEIVLDFHSYNKSLPSILFIDPRGYVRWHAVGLPSEESTVTAKNLLQKLIREKN
jgi:hypothetical protein